MGAISSGNTSAAATVLQTFNPLFPRGLYYGYIDSTGSPNATVIHPELSLTISPTVSILATHFSFWRTSGADGIYSQPGFLLRAGNQNQSRYVGSLQDLAPLAPTCESSRTWRSIATVLPTCRQRFGMLMPAPARLRSFGIDCRCGGQIHWQELLAVPHRRPEPSLRIIGYAAGTMRYIVSVSSAE
jgi:hypothetical protein